ncbi:MAG: hypothetical protein MCM46_10855 [Candidatus Manganitrophus sp. SB1]|nr:hypothetical protein [Candidatus Manganitrophus morganii]
MGHHQIDRKEAKLNEYHEFRSGTDRCPPAADAVSTRLPAVTWLSWIGRPASSDRLD